MELESGGAEAALREGVSTVTLVGRRTQAWRH
jgi:hypothetical protein